MSADDELTDALRRGLDDDPVDLASLLVGARHGARRIRRRRRAGAVAVAAALVAVAAPLGGDLLDRAPGPVPAASVPSPTVAPTAVAPTTAAQAPTVSRLADGSVLVPPEAMLTVADVPVPGATAEDLGPVADTRTLGTLCDEADDGPGHEDGVGGRRVDFYGSQGGGATHVVRVFTGDGAAQQMQHARQTLATCPSGAWVPQVAEGLPGDEAVLAVGEDLVGPGMQSVAGAVRVGDATVGVRLDVRDTPEKAVEAGRALLVAAHERLLESGTSTSVG